MRPRVASVQLKTRVGSNSSKDSGEFNYVGLEIPNYILCCLICVGSSPKLRRKDPVKILRNVTHKVTKEVNKAIKR